MVSSHTMIIVDSIIVILSFYILTKLVDDRFLPSLDNISDYLKLSPSVAGATLLAVGTSAPELSTALFALMIADADPALGLGTIVGSAIFQILVVVGFVAIMRTTYLDWKPVVRDGVFYAFTIIQLVLIVDDGTLTFLESASLLTTYLLYLSILWWWSKNVPEKNGIDPIDIVTPVSQKENTLNKVWMILARPIRKIIYLIPDPEENKKATFPVFIISLLVIAALSYILVLSAERMALVLGIPSTIIGLTILAGGSSVPELASSAILSRQGRGDMAMSNAIGSNVFDILVSLGLPLFIFTALNGDIHDIGDQNITSSIFLLFATLISVLVLLAIQKFKVGRWFGWILIGMYVLYVIAAYGGLL